MVTVASRLVVFFPFIISSKSYAESQAKGIGNDDVRPIHFHGQIARREGVEESERTAASLLQKSHTEEEPGPPPDPLPATEGDECADAGSQIICDMLKGSNAEVARKLEHAISGTNIEQTGNAEVAKIEHDESGKFTTVKGCFWTMYFCTKQTTPDCHPRTSTDPDIKAARDCATNGLRDIKADDATAKDAGKKAYLDALHEISGVCDPDKFDTTNVDRRMTHGELKDLRKEKQECEESLGYADQGEDEDEDEDGLEIDQGKKQDDD